MTSLAQRPAQQDAGPAASPLAASLAPPQLAALGTGRGILCAAMCSDLTSFLTRRDLNSTLAADPTLFWRDPHPGRMIHACNRRDMPRLRALLDCPGAPYGWPSRQYRRFGNTYDAATLFDAAVNAYWEEGALFAVSYQPWTEKQAARAISDQLVHTTWTAVADALLTKTGPEVITRLQHGPTSVCCFMGTEAMIRWYVAHGLDINVRSDLDGQTALHGAVHFTNKARVQLLLSLGARVDANMLDECFRQYHYHREEDPEGSGDWDAMEILGLLIPHTTPAVLNGGCLPLHRLVSEVWGRADLLTLLLKHGADVNQRSHDGRTALWWAQNADFGMPCQEYVTAILRAGGK
jgi:hypothetical protein